MLINPKWSKAIRFLPNPFYYSGTVFSQRY
jgi:hypothetical protein